MAQGWRPDEGRAITGRAVLLHDVAASAATWRRVGPLLSRQGWETLALDLPAHGSAARTQRIDRPLDLTTLATSVVGELPGRADLLVGHGLGGIVALILAGRYADIARAVVIEDPPVAGTANRDALIRQILLESAFSRADREGLYRRLAAAHPSWTEADIEQTIDDLAAADVPTIVAGLRSRMTWDLPALVSQVRVPLLVIAAREDPLEPVGQTGTALCGSERKEVRNLLPDASFLELDGGHHLHRDRTAEWVHAVAGFATKVLS